MPYTGSGSLPVDAVAGQGTPTTQFNQLKNAVVDARSGAIPITGETEAVVIHDGTTGGGTRPAGYTRVRWVSPVGATYSRPTNMAAGDLWEHDATTGGGGTFTATYSSGF